MASELRIKLLVESDQLEEARQAFISCKPLPGFEDWRICWIGHDRERNFSFVELKKEVAG